MLRAPVVTISAAYGAGGSRVAPLLAEHLGVSFAERLMDRGLADRIAGNCPAREDDRPA